MQNISWSSAYCNNDYFMGIHTCSGFRTSAYDPNGKQHFLNIDDSDETLGLALLDSLAHSRFLSLEEVSLFFDYKLVAQRYSQWVTMLINGFNYPNKKALFKHMKWCNIEMQNHLIKIKPLHHQKLEGWGREKGDGTEDVFIEATRPASEIGVALREAFTRCR